MKRLIIAVVIIVAGIEFGGMAYDKMQASITSEVEGYYRQAESRADQ